MHNITLKKVLTDDFAGVILITATPLSLELPYVAELDYFFDGAIRRHITHTKHTNPLVPNLFFTENFGQAITLIHLEFKTEKDQLLAELTKISNLIVKSVPTTERKILYLDLSSRIDLQTVSKIFPEFQLINL